MAPAVEIATPTTEGEGSAEGPTERTACRQPAGSGLSRERVGHG